MSDREKTFYLVTDFDYFGRAETSKPIPTLEVMTKVFGKVLQEAIEAYPQGVIMEDPTIYTSKEEGVWVFHQEIEGLSQEELMSLSLEVSGLLTLWDDQNAETHSGIFHASIQIAL